MHDATDRSLATTTPEGEASEGLFPLDGADEDLPADDVTYHVPESPQPHPADEDVTDAVSAAAEEYPTTPDEATPEASPLAQAGKRARRAAQGAQQSLREGVNAFRDVRSAAQRHAQAKSELDELETILDEHVQELEHRLDIEQRYPQIVSARTRELEELQASLEQSAQRMEQLEAERSDLEARLAQTKAANEEQLRPYRSLAESTKGRADDAARALAEAKRAAKAAESALSEATRLRDQRITAANRTVDNAHERLRKVQEELGALQRDGTTDTDTLELHQRELATETAHLSQAQAEVESVTSEMRRRVDEAQQRLFDLRQAQAQAERDADTARREANDRRSDYDSLLRQAQDRENALADELKQRVAGLEVVRREISDAQAQKEEAQAALDEAEAVHATPQQTISLREQVAREQTDRDVAHDTVQELADQERSIRKDTRRQRLTLVLAGVAVLALVIGIIVFVLLGRSKASKTTVSEDAPIAQQAPATEEPKNRKGSDDATTTDAPTDAKADKAGTAADAKAPTDEASKDAQSTSDQAAQSTSIASPNEKKR